jgi:MerR family redox-sensitive transcriptional activator SoxR
MISTSTLSIGELARRTGLSVSAIRYYEVRGLVHASRGAGNQRRFARADIRRLSFALILRQLGLTLNEIETELAMLPRGQAPTVADWTRISVRLRTALAQKIKLLQRTQELLDGVSGADACRWQTARSIIQMIGLHAADQARAFYWATSRQITNRAEDVIVCPSGRSYASATNASRSVQPMQHPHPPRTNARLCPPRYP